MQRNTFRGWAKQGRIIARGATARNYLEHGADRVGVFDEDQTEAPDGPDFEELTAQGWQLVPVEESNRRKNARRQATRQANREQGQLVKVTVNHEKRSVRGWFGQATTLLKPLLKQRGYRYSQKDKHWHRYNVDPDSAAEAWVYMSERYPVRVELTEVIDGERETVLCVKGLRYDPAGELLDVPANHQATPAPSEEDPEWALAEAGQIRQVMSDGEWHNAKDIDPMTSGDSPALDALFDSFETERFDGVERYRLKEAA